jgi:hypothetical protein
MEGKRVWESKLRAHHWLTFFRPTRKAKLVHDLRFVAWPILRGLFGRR